MGRRSEKLLDPSDATTMEAAMFGMMRDGIMTGPMTWGMGLGMGLVAVVLVLGAVALNIWSPVRGRSHHAVRHVLTT